MFNGVRKALYKMSRATGSAASKLTDIDVLLTGDPKKIIKRIKRKSINKTIYKTANKVSRKVNKKW